MGPLKSSASSLAARLALAGVATLGGILIVRQCRQRLLRSKLRLPGCHPESTTPPPTSSDSALEAFNGTIAEDLVASAIATSAIDGAELDAAQQPDSPTSVPLPPALECLSECKAQSLISEASTSPGQVPSLPENTASTAAIATTPTAAADEAASSGANDGCHLKGRSDSDSDADGDEAPSPSGRQSLATYLSRHGLERCEFIKVLGQGGYGRCELVSVPLPRGEGGPLLAVRKILLKRKDGLSRTEALRLEVAGTLAAKGCDCAVQLLASTQPKTDDDDHMLLLSYVPGGSLCDYLDALFSLQTYAACEASQSSSRKGKKGKGGKAPASRTLLPEPLLKELARSVLTAVGTMHSNNMGHFDISSDNVFVDDSCGDLRFVLGDMGVAEPADAAGFVRVGAAGKRFYAAPEVYTQLTGGVAEGGVSLKADMVSVGMLLAESAAFRSGMTQMRGYLRGECDLPARIPPALKDLIERLVNPSPEARPSAMEALAHPYLQA
ncbi:hypothetical protein HYH02_003274 [Chlamydomonas schloesseri]|uniref:Protein kinase domain-containing protein n=1 Tax=Chlamydomonas schloesseri TaxID=2026947 RepID=A0A835WQW4_9CHLO|nr:hypothetical protein HYH02_003274 [Chlamydomonas schloesseri]|eukprot:KAG2452247.1 hypothetical protein HYH02_003274 [Chlamydomonas schloesseri]